jgi:PTS system mannose-specific IIA component
MVGIVIVTHGPAATALAAAANAIVGKMAALATVCVGTRDAQPAIVARLSRACDEVDGGGGVLLLVDLHGSTPFQAAMSMLDGTRPAEVLCGVNLPMLIKLVTVDRTRTTPSAIAEELRDVGRRSIRLGSELTGKVVVGERG